MKTKKRMFVDKFIWSDFKTLAHKKGYTTNKLLEEVLKTILTLDVVEELEIIEGVRIGVEIDRDLWFCLFEKSADLKKDRHNFLNGVLRVYLDEQSQGLDT
ncbi:MAG: hypothetical protein AB7V00_05275 [Bacilli bacterium]